METKEKRGSEELARRLEQPTVINKDDLRRLVQSADSVSARILGWEIYGQPAIERLRATFSVAPDKLGPFVDRLMRDKLKFTLKGFPKGVPPFEMESIELEISQGMGG